MIEYIRMAFFGEHLIRTADAHRSVEFHRATEDLAQWWAERRCMAGILGSCRYT